MSMNVAHCRPSVDKNCWSTYTESFAAYWIISQSLATGNTRLSLAFCSSRLHWRFQFFYSYGDRGCCRRQRKQRWSVSFVDYSRPKHYRRNVGNSRTDYNCSGRRWRNWDWRAGALAWRCTGERTAGDCPSCHIATRWRTGSSSRQTQWRWWIQSSPGELSSSSPRDWLQWLPVGTANT